MTLPPSFIDSVRSLLGDEELEKLSVALSQEPPVSLRFNPFKTLFESSEGRLVPRCRQVDWQAGLTVASGDVVVPSTLPVASEQVPWASGGYYLPTRPTFTFDPLFHAGCYYVQEASSMFVEQALRRYVTRPVVALDLCAAPGGKSTHLRSTLPEGSLLVANEVIRSRSQILAENLTKWGHPDVVVTNSDPSAFAALPALFDVILADVPCSGEGMFRKDAGAVSEWSPENVDICWQRQRRIIADVWPALRPGGLLLYSTCTYNTKEDEENVCWMQQELGAEPLSLPLSDEWGITGDLYTSHSLPVCHFFPHKTKGEGFFFAALRKPVTGEETEDAPSFSAKNKAGSKKGKGKNAVFSPSKDALRAVMEWLRPELEERYLVSAEENSVYAFPRCHQETLQLLRSALKIVQAGVALGEVKGKDLIPAHALAMSVSLLRDDAFPVCEVDYSRAIAYLRKEAITLPPAVVRGYVLLTYRGFPLGFVKNIGNRANNLYPQEWRIRSGYLPEEISVL